MNSYRETTIPFQAGDGMPLNLIRIQGAEDASLGPVMLVHGAGVRGNIFRAPVEITIVDALIAAGYEVWLENWRASIDVPPNTWTLDQAALYDHPNAVAKVIEVTGAASLKAIIHCQGSTSFMMSLVAGLVPQVDTVVSNAVSLFPIVPTWSRYKLKYAIPMFHRLTDYVNPQWGKAAPDLVSKFLASFVKLTHHECDNAVCKMVSFVYGTGFPALWRHENLNPATHDWLADEFAAVSMAFFEQMRRCVAVGHLISHESLPGLPQDYLAQPPQTDARFCFLTGDLNLCFLPESQQRAFDYFDDIKRNYHSLHRFPTYSHLDIFMGKHAAKDVFPTIVKEIARSKECLAKESS